MDSEVMKLSEQEYAKIVAKNLRRLAYENEKSQIDIAKAIGVHKSTVSAWMNATRTPRMDKVDMLCRYFGCRRSDIMEPEEKQKPREVYLDDEAREYIEFLHNNPKYKVLFDASRKVKAEDVDFVRKMIERFSE